MNHTLSSWNRLTKSEKRGIERATLRAHLDHYGMEAARALLRGVELGQIDGSTYYDPVSECGCILGTLARGSGVDVNQVGSQDPLSHADVTTVTHGVFASEEGRRVVEEWEEVDPVYTVAEVLAVQLRPGATPENNAAARLIQKWVRGWIRENG